MTAKFTSAFCFRLLAVIVAIMAFTACNEGIIGDFKTNIKPQTYTIADTIIKIGGDRFNTKVEIKWWGDDTDGFIEGYEFTFDTVINDRTTWYYTQKTDSTFLFAIPQGADTLNIPFTVRAIDNKGEKDDTPARLWYPIKNSKPQIEFIYLPPGSNPLTGGNPESAFPVLRYYWNASDIDGIENLKAIEIYLNDTSTAPYVVSPQLNAIMFVAENPRSTTSSSICKVFPGNLNNALATKINGMLLNDTNRVYIRAVDLSDAKSPLIAALPVYVKRPISNVLLVDAYFDQTEKADTFYSNRLNDLSITFDRLKLLSTNTAGDYNNLAPDNLTQARIFELFDHVIWFSDNMEFSMTFGQNTLGKLIDKGGNLLMSLRPSGQSPVKSGFYDFSPLDSLYGPPAGATLLLLDTSTVLGIAPGYSNLGYSEILSVVRPVKFYDGAVPLLKANIQKRIGFNITPYTGPSTVMGIKTNPISGGKFVISTLQLHKLNKLNNSLQLFNQILRVEFGI